MAVRRARVRPRSVRWERLGTERANPRSRDLDRMTPLAIARLMNREDRRAVAAVGREVAPLAAGVTLIVDALRGRGRLFFVGAGTSGRLGVLEAAECPPTFGTRPGEIQALVAGGRRAVFRSREGAEDDQAAAARTVRRHVRPGDVVVGVSASGVTPFVHAALDAARGCGAKTILVACNRPSGARATAGARAAHQRAIADVVIAPSPGPEIVAGSTRLKAGTATKLVLNTLTTAAMAGLGKVYGNRMVDLVPRSRKLRERAVRLVQELGGVSRPRAARMLEAARGRARLAIVMARTGLDAGAAARALAQSGGSLRAVLDVSERPERRGAVRVDPRRGPPGRRPTSTSHGQRRRDGPSTENR